MNDNFRLLCKEKDITVAQASRDTKIPLSTLNAWANGKTKTLKDKNAAKLADYFGVSVDYLMGREEQEERPGKKAEALSEEEIMLLAMYRAVHPDQRKMLYSVVEAALKSQGLL